MSRFDVVAACMGTVLLCALVALFAMLSYVARCS